jgi:curved DNA-binding protein CbpA
MDIKKCFEILELDPHASMDEVKQAYKDIVNVWHPDRFSHNPRLKEKAEEKLKELNVAYEKVTSFLSSKKRSILRPEQTPPTDHEVNKKTETKAKPRSEGAYKDFQGEAEARDKTEAVAEAGTRMFLEACSFLYSAVRRIIDRQTLKPGPKDDAGPRGPYQTQGQGRARGKGMGRGAGRGRGRGRGMGKGRGWR